MKISEVTIKDLKEYAYVEHNEDDKLFESILLSSISFIRNYTGLTDSQMDEKEDLTIALKVIANEFYDNRAFEIKSSNANKLITSILNMYSMNLL
ncbi:MAG: phage gp6-like head-tail connector protein [Clostridium sp.]|uniref:head-tail connector protein n=1 Tax=Clostridium sp. TaxID=1506 RepID=UPI0025C3BD22|nr:head-tail connector protein [Clostridium sp.]MCF0149153.1 phage gp6-like head-tail connector protein [Clostridium sp.]